MHKMDENEANHVLLSLSGRQLLISDTLHSNESSKGIHVTACTANMPHWVRQIEIMMDRRLLSTSLTIMWDRRLWCWRPGNHFHRSGNKLFRLSRSEQCCWLVAVLWRTEAGYIPNILGIREKQGFSHILATRHNGGELPWPFYILHN